MTTYVIQANDTFRRISQREYGFEGKESLIQKANPGISEPLLPGTEITIPRDSQAPQLSPITSIDGDSNTVGMTIDNNRFLFWESIDIKLAIDGMSTITFTAPFEPDEELYREAFRPFTYKPVVITVGDELLFTGVMMPPPSELNSDRRSVTVEAYSLPGVLQDCTAPSSAYPLEFNDQVLLDIATVLVEPFGLSVELEGDQGSVFTNLSLEPNNRILPFIAKLAKQRNRVVSSTREGNLAIIQSVDVGSPVARLTEGSPPVVSIVPIFNGQRYYSHVTGIEPTIVGIAGEKFTKINERIKGIVRPFTFTANDSNSGDIQQAVEARVGRMFAAAASYDLTVSSWRDVNGQLWAPNTTLTLISPGAMIYTEYEFLIRGVRLSKTNGGETAVLELVMPGAFDGKLPDTLPWDE